MSIAVVRPPAGLARHLLLWPMTPPLLTPTSRSHPSLLTAMPSCCRGPALVLVEDGLWQLAGPSNVTTLPSEHRLTPDCAPSSRQVWRALSNFVYFGPMSVELVLHLFFM
jgi:hypothetical protein